MLRMESVDLGNLIYGTFVYGREVYIDYGILIMELLSIEKCIELYAILCVSYTNYMILTRSKVTGLLSGLTGLKQRAQTK